MAVLLSGRGPGAEPFVDGQTQGDDEATTYRERDGGGRIG
jgi:hypothetical protein